MLHLRMKLINYKQIYKYINLDTVKTHSEGSTNLIQAIQCNQYNDNTRKSVAVKLGENNY